MRPIETTLALAGILLATGTALAQPKPEKPPELPPVAARLRIVAPTSTGSWTMRIDNEGDKPIRVPADVRLLRFEVETTEGKRKKKTSCTPPADLRSSSFPEARALLLAPGESYVEQFDPRLICFGKDAAALVPGATVRARFGWNPPPKWSKKPPEPPLAAQGTDQPPSTAPLRELVAPTMVLSYAPASPSPAPASPPTESPPKVPEKPGGVDTTAAKSAPEKKPTAENEPRPHAIVDANAPRIELSASPYSDASGPARASVTVTATNVGHRATLAALRSRMLEFRIDGPEGKFVCEATPGTHAIPRDLYRSIKPKERVSFTVLLSEVCPPEALARAGMYRVDAVLHADASGEELGIIAYTGTSTTKEPALLRLRTAPLPFYKNPPKAVPAPKRRTHNDTSDSADSASE